MARAGRSLSLNAILKIDLIHRPNFFGGFSRFVLRKYSIIWDVLKFVCMTNKQVTNFFLEIPCKVLDFTLFYRILEPLDKAPPRSAVTLRIALREAGLSITGAFGLTDTINSRRNDRR